MPTKRFKRNTSYLGHRSDSKAIYGLGGNFYTLSANRSKNALYGVLRGHYRLSVVYQVIFLLITRLGEVLGWRYIVTVV